MNNRICIVDAQGACKAEANGREEAILAWSGAYEPGDVILFEVDQPGHYMVRVDDCLDEALVYLAQNTLRYSVLFDKKRTPTTPRPLLANGTI